MPLAKEGIPEYTIVKRLLLSELIRQEAAKADPCPDCPYTFHVIAGKAQVVAQCKNCRTWYEAYLEKGYATEGYTTIYIGDRLTAKSKNGLLRCDALAPYTYIIGIPETSCWPCMKKRGASAVPLASPMQPISDLVLQPQMHIILCDLTQESYQRTRFPAYTIQRRCGAVPAYTWGYAQFATKNQLQRTDKYLTERLHQIRLLHARRKGEDTSAIEPIPYDCKAAADIAATKEADLLAGGQRTYVGNPRADTSQVGASGLPSNLPWYRQNTNNK